VSESPSGKATEDVTCNRDALRTEEKPQFATLTFDELALLPLCGIPAYRAVKTCLDAFPVENDRLRIDRPTSECPHPTPSRHRRALVLRGHDGVGAMAVQMLVRQGWRVSVHVPFSRVPWDATQAEGDEFMLAIEDRLKKWGADEVIYDDGVTYANWDGELDDRKAAVVRVIETLRADGDVFDAVLDLVGGKEIREACGRLLRLNGCPESHGIGQFTTLLGDAPDDPISISDHFHSNLRNSSTFTFHEPRSYANEHIGDTQSEDMERRVEYTCMTSVFESEDEEVCEILGTILRLALEDGIRPHVEEVGGEIFGRKRVVSLEKASDVLLDGDLLSDGGMVVVRVVR
jgi:NADPH:quinone reductase-like Zn-dependent oxidoreductase